MSFGGRSSRSVAPGLEEPSAMMKALRKTRPWFIVDPRRSWSINVWDGLTSLALVFTAIVTPFEVALLEPAPTWEAAGADSLFLINRAIDVIFLGDMLLQFVMMIQSVSDRDGVKWIDDPKLIIKSYLRSWFALDLISLIPSTFDYIPLMSADGADASRWRECGAWRCLVSTDTQSLIYRMKVLRVLRIFRLVKLVRLLRASRILRRWESRFSFHYATLSLASAVMMYMIFAHWAACIALLPTNFLDEPVSTWLGAQGYCVSEPTEVTEALVVAQTAMRHHSTTDADAPALYHLVPEDDDSCFLRRGLAAEPGVLFARLLDGSCSVRCASPGQIYVGALFFTLQLINSCGGYSQSYRDSNTQEQIVFAVLTVLGSLLWGHVIGVIVSVIANSNPDLTAFRNTMDALNQFMAMHRLPNEMRMRLREYFQQTRHVRRGQQRKHLLALMSPQLQGEVCMAINKRQLQSVRFLAGAEQELIVLIAVSLQPAVFAPGELTTPGYLYIIHKGVALYGGRVLTSGKVWGQDMILRRQALCHFSARAMSYLEVYRLSRGELLELARPFPIGWSKIRWEAFRLALIRTISATKRACKLKIKGRTVSDQAWTSFLESASAAPDHHRRSSQTESPEVASPEASKRRASLRTEIATLQRNMSTTSAPTINPFATEERPSMGVLASSIDRMRADIELIKLAVGAAAGSSQGGSKIASPSLPHIRSAPPPYIGAAGGAGGLDLVQSTPSQEEVAAVSRVSEREPNVE